MKKILILAIVLNFINLSYASTYVACSTDEERAGTCFTCGTTCTARYVQSTNEDGSSKGTLTISGSGDMDFYRYSYNDDLERYQSDAPWKNLDRDITNVIVEEGITSVSGFYNHTTIESVSLPNTLTTIERACFQSAKNLTDLTIPPNVTTIGHAAFNGTKVEYLTIPENYQAYPGGAANSNNAYLFGTYALKGITIEGNADFEKYMLLGANLSKLRDIYCDMSNENCRALLEDEDIGSKIKFYEKNGSQYLYEGKFYKHPSDIALGNYAKKRIYTLQEAVELSKPTGNTVRIRYK